MISLARILILVLGWIGAIGWLSLSSIKTELEIQFAVSAASLLALLLVAGLSRGISFFVSTTVTTGIFVFFTWLIVAFLDAPETEYFRAFYFFNAVVLGRAVIELIGFADLLALPISNRATSNLLLYKVFLERGAEVSGRLSYHARNRYSSWIDLKGFFQARLAMFLAIFFFLLGEGDNIQFLIENRRIGAWRRGK